MEQPCHWDPTSKHTGQGNCIRVDCEKEKKNKIKIVKQNEQTNKKDA